MTGPMTEPVTEPVAGPNKRAESSKPVAVVAIGGLDPSSGAGIVADARSLDAMGVLPCTVATAITVQSGSGVIAYESVRASLVVAQLEELLASLPVGAVKIGQIPSRQIAEALAPVLRQSKLPLVLDPVRSATGGGRLSGPGAAAAVVQRLFPLASVVTANLAEAAELAGLGTTAHELTDESAMVEAARRIIRLGPRAVVVKGGHLAGDPIDVLVSGNRVTRFDGKRLGTSGSSMHGTGCAFASALAAGLGQRRSLVGSVEAAREHVRGLIAGAQTVGGAKLRRPVS